MCVYVYIMRNCPNRIHVGEFLFVQQALLYMFMHAYIMGNYLNGIHVDENSNDYIICAHVLFTRPVSATVA